MRFLAALLMLLTLGSAAAAQPVDAGHVTAELVSASQGVAPGQTIRVALRQQIDAGWHTYWRNAGDSGEATRLTWTLPAGWRAGEFTWPAPKRLPVGPLMNYGYEGEVLLPVALTAPADAKPGQTVQLQAMAQFLVCADICIPEQAELKLSLPVTSSVPAVDPQWGGRITRAISDAPAPAGLNAAFRRTATGIELAVTGEPLKAADLASAYFFPYAEAAIDHAKPQVIERGPEGLTLTLTPGSAFTEGAGPEKLAGVLSLGSRAYEVTAQAGPLPSGASGLGPPVSQASGGGLSLAPAILLAFVGGLILNLMPCVFPVLAMKAASLAGHAHEAPAARRQALAFGAGVLATFLALAGLLIALKAAGSAVGWGFQLQSPPVVAVLALLMLAVALNLAGVFEVAGRLQNAGSGLASRQGLAGAFFTGALAVVVAAPCTAPFMGPALGWALTQPPLAALLVFLSLGVGFALPFVLVAFAPGLLARLPRPGPWMDVFKKVLAFPMLAAAAWLVWVLTLQAGPEGLARVLAAAIVLALALWLLGAAQRRGRADRRAFALSASGALLSLAALAVVVWPAYAEGPSTTGAPTPGLLAAEPYSPARLAELRAQGRPVFVNYTAAWCVSCQVNERLALSTARTAEAVKRNGVVYLKADWTKKDAMIAAELARFGRAGVPLYLVYGAGGGEPKVLPSILTEGAVVRALDAAAAGTTVAGL